MKDNFDLKKFLKENKSLENLNPSLKNINEGEEKQLNENSSIRSKIREMIISELSEEKELEEDTLEEDTLEEDTLDEAKEDEEEEITDETDEIETEEETEEVDVESGGGLEDISADMEGTEGELMDHLMSAFKISKGMDNEKLETQIGNTLKFFVSEFISGEEN